MDAIQAEVLIGQAIRSHGWDVAFSVFGALPLFLAGLMYLLLRPLPSGLDIDEVRRRLQAQDRGGERCKAGASRDSVVQRSQIGGGGAGGAPSARNLFVDPHLASKTSTTLVSSSTSTSTSTCAARIQIQAGRLCAGPGSPGAIA